MFASPDIQYRMNQMTFSNIIHYYIGPPVLIILFTLLGPIFPIIGTEKSLEWNWNGNSFGWKVLGVMLLWALLSLNEYKGRIYEGPETASGYRPLYSDNGMKYFQKTTIIYGVFLVICRPFATILTENFLQVLAACNIFGLLFCCYLLLMGKYFPQSRENMEKLPIIYEFYRGMETHPRFLKRNVKQFIICRFSMMAWHLLNMTFYTASLSNYGFNFASLTILIMQSVYIGKFFYWERGYFGTIDILHDRAGYYLCWGSLVWVPSMFTFIMFFMAFRVPKITTKQAFTVLCLELVAVYFNYTIDRQKQRARNSDGRCNIWGRPANFIRASYRTGRGMKNSILLTSGFWGLARRINYTIEFLIGMLWAYPASGYGIFPYTYPIFTLIFIIHRIARDEDKCRKKYGEYYEEYCKQVPYRLIPYIF